MERWEVINAVQRIQDYIDEHLNCPIRKAVIKRGNKATNYFEYCEEVWEVIKKYDPQIYGFEWADDDTPRIQLEPQGYRGYKEARPVTQINCK